MDTILIFWLEPGMARSSVMILGDWAKRLMDKMQSKMGAQTTIFFKADDLMQF
jgi:hypothetical protein